MKFTAFILVVGLVSTALAFTTNSPRRKEEIVDNVVNSLSHDPENDKSFECVRSCFGTFVQEAIELTRGPSTTPNPDYPAFRFITGVLPVYESFDKCIMQCDDGELKCALKELKKPFDFIKAHMFVIGDSIKCYEDVARLHNKPILQCYKQHGGMTSPPISPRFLNMAAQVGNPLVVQVQEMARKTCDIHHCINSVMEPNMKRECKKPYDAILAGHLANKTVDALMYFWTKRSRSPVAFKCPYSYYPKAE